jgi:hypothetical protein
VRSTSLLLLAACLALVLGACGAADDAGSPPPDTTDDGATDVDGAGEPVDGADVDGADVDGADVDGTDDGAVEDRDLDAAVDEAVRDLASSEGVAEDEVEVVTAEQVTWSDGALGCPEPGMMYTQALVPGYRIVLAAGGDEVAYHGAEGDAPTRCDDPQPPADSGS